MIEEIPEYTLNESEMMICRFVGSLRAFFSRKLNMKNLKESDRSDLEIDVDGVVGEWAFCRIYNLFPFIAPYPRPGMPDCYMGNFAIDIKSTRLPQGKLMCSAKPNDKIDIYVLGVIDGYTVRYPGFAKHGKLRSEENLNHQHERYELVQGSLDKFTNLGFAYE